MWGANMDEGTCAFPLHGIEGVWLDSFLISGNRPLRFLRQPEMIQFG